MPRGVYDRTKTAEQRAAEKTGKPAKAAPTKKAPKAAKAEKVAKAAPVKKAAIKAPAAPKVSTSSKLDTNEIDNVTKFHIVRENISALAGAVHSLTGGQKVEMFAPNAELVGLLDEELRANLGVLTSLRRDTFGLSETEQSSETKESEPETDNEVHTNVAAPAQPYPQGTVPMPPSATPPAPAGFPAQ